MGINDILDLINLYPALILFLIIPAVFGINVTWKLVGILLDKWLSKSDFWSNRKKRITLKKSGVDLQLKSHHFFSDMTKIINYDLKAMALPIPRCAKRMLRDMLTIQFNVFYDNYSKFTQSKEFEGFSESFSKGLPVRDDFLYTQIGLYNSCLEEYLTKWKAGGIPEPVIMRFSSWYQSIIDALLENITVTIADNLAGDPAQMMISILQGLISHFKLVPNQVGDAANGITGDLAEKPLSYKGLDLLTGKPLAR